MKRRNIPALIPPKNGNREEIKIFSSCKYAVTGSLRLMVKKPNSKVIKVNIAIGELEHVSDDHFEFHFRERTKGTPLEDAKLNFKKVMARFRCKQCGVEFKGEEGLEGCPKCRGKISDIIEGAGISVESVEIV